MGVNSSGGLIDPGLARFVDLHVRTLLSWEILLFFQKHPTAVLDAPALAARLGRRPEDLAEDLEQLCHAGILSCAGGLVRYQASGELARSVDRFAYACSDRAMRMALVAQVLEKIDRTFRT